MRAWWAAMVAAGRWYQVVVNDIRRLDANRVAVLGEIRYEGKPLSPWAVVIRISNGLIVESHSYVSDVALLEKLGVLR